MLRLLLAWLHLLALGVGLGAVLTRGSLLRKVADETVLKLVFRYDAVWGIAALLWISTGLWRYLGSVEKSFSYYNGNHLFLTKMALLVVLLVIEAKPAMTLGRWRKQSAAGVPLQDFVDPGTAKRIAITSHVEALIVVIMVLLAAGMARGFGAT